MVFLIGGGGRRGGEGLRKLRQLSVVSNLVELGVGVVVGGLGGGTTKGAQSL